MSYEISRTNNGDNSGLAIANIKKSQCLTWRGKREGIAIKRYHVKGSQGTEWSIHT